MKGYVIKVTYLSGRHKGKTYLMAKGGKIPRSVDYLFESDIYKTLGTAKSVCKRLFNNNERNRRIEDMTREYALSKGREIHDWFIYEHESYEPYEVEYSKDII
jgi:hypothetical protein